MCGREAFARVALGVCAPQYLPCSSLSKLAIHYGENEMKKAILLIAGLFLLATGTAQAQQAAQAPGVVQLFLCNLNEGKSAANVWELLETLASRITDRQPGFNMFVWTPMRGYTQYDYIWGATATDLAEMASGLQGYIDSGSAAFMGPRFQEVNKHCDSTITMAEEIKAGSIGNTGDRMPDAIVETFACTINPGSSMADVDAAVEFWKAQIPGIGSDALAKYEATLLTPFRGSNGMSDFAWIGASPDLATWAQGSMDYYGSKGGQAADARFNKVSSCRNALWTGYWILPPAAE